MQAQAAVLCKAETRIKAQEAEILNLKQQLAVYNKYCVCFDNGTHASSPAE